MSGPIGKTLGGLLVLELTTLQVCSLEKNLFSIGWNLATESLEQSFGWISIVNQLSSVLVQQGQQVLQFGSDFCR